MIKVTAMKVLIATGLYPPEIGGPATYTKMLEKHLPQHDIELVTLPFGQVRQYPKLIRHLVYLRELYRHAKDADIVYALDPVSVGLPALIVSRLRGKKFLLRLGGDYAWEQSRQRFGVTATLEQFVERKGKFGVLPRCLFLIQRFVAKRAIKVIVPSNYLGIQVKQWGISPDSIVTIYSALFSLPVHEPKEQLRAKLNFDFPTLISAGRLVPWKGFAELITVAHRLRSEYPNLTLVILGDGPERTNLEQLVRERKLEGVVRLLGDVSKDTLGGVISAGDVFVLNTGYEGLSHQLLEVMDLGVPLITTSVGGNTELIRGGENGSLITYGASDELERAIRHLLSDEALQQKLVAGGKVTAEKFRVESVVLNIVALLHQVHETKS